MREALLSVLVSVLAVSPVVGSRPPLSLRAQSPLPSTQGWEIRTATTLKTTDTSSVKPGDTITMSGQVRPAAGGMLGSLCELFVRVQGLRDLQPSETVITADAQANCEFQIPVVRYGNIHVKVEFPGRVFENGQVSLLPSWADTLIAVAPPVGIALAVAGVGPQNPLSPSVEMLAAMAVTVFRRRNAADDTSNPQHNVPGSKLESIETVDHNWFAVGQSPVLPTQLDAFATATGSLDPAIVNITLYKLFLIASSPALSQELAKMEEGATVDMMLGYSRRMTKEKFADNVAAIYAIVTSGHAADYATMRAGGGKIVTLKDITPTGLEDITATGCTVAGLMQMRGKPQSDTGGIYNWFLVSRSPGLLKQLDAFATGSGLTGATVAGVMQMRRNPQCDTGAIYMAVERGLGAEFGKFLKDNVPGLKLESITTDDYSWFVVSQSPGLLKQLDAFATGSGLTGASVAGVMQMRRNPQCDTGAIYMAVMRGQGASFGKFLKDNVSGLKLESITAADYSWFVVSQSPFLLKELDAFATASGLTGATVAGLMQRRGSPPCDTGAIHMAVKRGQGASFGKFLKDNVSGLKLESITAADYSWFVVSQSSLLLKEFYAFATASGLTGATVAGLMQVRGKPPCDTGAIYMAVERGLGAEFGQFLKDNAPGLKLESTTAVDYSVFVISQSPVLLKQLDAFATASGLTGATVAGLMQMRGKADFDNMVAVIYAAVVSGQAAEFGQFLKDNRAKLTTASLDFHSPGNA
jgi:ABC-type thiamin/hydroxymethylpyrimidine transport system permease subunit